MRCVREGEKNADPCWGEVKRYSWDMDLPPLELCQGHLWGMMEPERRWLGRWPDDELPDG